LIISVSLILLLDITLVIVVGSNNTDDDFNIVLDIIISLRLSALSNKNCEVAGSPRCCSVRLVAFVVVTDR
jgi:hypothetical protein